MMAVDFLETMSITYEITKCRDSDDHYASCHTLKVTSATLYISDIDER